MSAPPDTRIHHEPHAESAADVSTSIELRPVQLVRLVARREVTQRLRSKWLIGSTLVMLLLILAVAVLPALFGGGDRYRVGLVGAPSVPIGDQLAAAADIAGRGATVELRPVEDRAAAERLVAAGSLDVAVVDGRQLVVDAEVDKRLAGVVNEAHRRAVLRAALADAGVPAGQIERAMSPPPLEVRRLNPRDPEAERRPVLAYAGVVLLFFQLIFAGSMIASGIVEEKTSRVVELLLAKARPSWLLTGKVLGMGIIGLTQLVGFVVIGLTAASLAGTIDLPPATVRVGVEVVAWFVLGFGLYACLFAMAGALAGRAEDLQSTSSLVSLLVMLGYGAAAATVAEPDGLIARVAALVPPTAPFVQPVRNSAGVAGAWEPVIGALAILATMVAVVRLAGRVYAGGALHFHGSLKLRDALARADQVGGATPPDPPGAGSRR